MARLPGILNWAIEGWQRPRERGRFVVPSSVRDVAQEIEDLSSPVAAFVREMCVVGAGYRVPIAELYEAWRRWCEGRQAVTTRQTFGRGSMRQWDWAWFLPGNHGRIEAIKQADAAAERARRDLWDTCSYPELKDRLVQVSERFRDLDAQRADVESRAADMRRFAEGDRQEIRFVANKAQEVELSERADRYEKSAKKLEAEAAALRPETNKLQQEEKWIRDLMLEPGSARIFPARSR